MSNAKQHQVKEIVRCGKGCCEECELTYYYPNKEKWDKGWRPDIVRD